MSQRTGSSSSERLLIGTVAVIGIVTMVFGFFGLRKSIFGPFVRTGLPLYKTPEQQHQEALVALKTKDTDRDTVSDYDELYLYRTNPYLEDTDSDGLPDGQEIAQNSDPNCPAGKTCRTPRVASSGSTGTVLEDLNTDGMGTTSDTGSASGTSGTIGPEGPTEEQMMQAFVEVFGDPTKITNAEAKKIAAGMTAAQLRSFFVNMGVPQEAVDKADEASLRQMMDEAFQGINFGSETTSGSGGTDAGY